MDAQNTYGGERENEREYNLKSKYQKFKMYLRPCKAIFICVCYTICI